MNTAVSDDDDDDDDDTRCKVTLAGRIQSATYGWHDTLWTLVTQCFAVLELMCHPFVCVVA